MPASTQRRISNIVTDARQKAFQRFNIDESAPPEAKLGYCSRFAPLLAIELAGEITDGDVQIQAGSIDPLNTDPHDDIECAKKAGEVHYWVVVTVGDTEYHCDIAADCSPEYRQEVGEAVIQEGKHPEFYFPIGQRYGLDDLTGGQCPHDALILWYSVHRARDTALEALNGSEEHSYVLEGQCHWLGEQLLQELAPRWCETDPSFGHGRVDCYIMWGGLDHPDGLHRREVEPADHVWVEATTIDGPIYVCDLYSLDPKVEGQPIVTTTLPENYARTVDGRVPLCQIDSDTEYGLTRFYT